MVACPAGQSVSVSDIAAMAVHHGPRFGEPRLHLHAREISIPLSKNKPPVHVVAPAPPHMHERLRACGWNAE